MPGVIALLDREHTARVEAIWDEMSAQFGVGRGFSGGIPHVTFHIGAHDVAAEAADVVGKVARATAPFTVYSGGLGVFTGLQPILYVPVARSPQAASLAERLTAELDAAGYPATDPYYTPERWIPHITMAQANLAGADMGALLAWLSQQDLSWELPLASISIARETPTSAEILGTFALGG